MNSILQLHEQGQSVWYDQLSRRLLDSGELDRMIAEDGLRGMTSNPTIFEKAIGGSGDYDSSLAKLAHEGLSVNEIYESLVIDDIRRAADSFRPLYDSTEGTDGFVSLEVSPKLAYDTSGTVEEAERLFKKVGRPNVMIKVPATAEGIPAVEELIARGLNINITLIFSIAVYREVMEAYIKGLTRRKTLEPDHPEGGSVRSIASVASFFVSRIDTAVDSLLEERISQTVEDEDRAWLSTLLGKVAIANARLAYEAFQSVFGSERFKSLAAKPQRPLWASTGTKNPNYADVLYVEELIGPDTVNTVPPATFLAFKNHGRVRRTIDVGLPDARDVFAELPEFGIDIDAITRQLTVDGVKSFEDSFDKLMATIEQRRHAVMAK